MFFGTFGIQKSSFDLYIPLFFQRHFAYYEIMTNDRGIDRGNEKFETTS